MCHCNIRETVCVSQGRQQATYLEVFIPTWGTTTATQAQVGTVSQACDGTVVLSMTLSEPEMTSCDFIMVLFLLFI